MLIFLTGFMGSGKTMLGKELAKKLNYSFTDTDAAAELLTGKSIQQLFDEEGESYFRLRETEVLHSFKGKKQLVVATGGGLPCFEDNMDWMNQHGITVYLKLHRGVLFRRLLPEKQSRPLISKLGDVALMEFIMEKLPERRVYYNQSKITLNAENLTADDLLQALRKSALFK